MSLEGVRRVSFSSPRGFLHWRKLVTIIPEDDVGVELAENVDPWTGREEIADYS